MTTDAVLCTPSAALAVVCEDIIVNGVLAGRAPLALSTWRRRTGLSELPPLCGEASRKAWARRVGIDAAALHAYAHAVHVSTDAYLAGAVADETANRLLTAVLQRQVRV
jgi:hypothetical protein